MSLSALKVPLFVLCCALLMILIERIWPGRAWPKVRGWWTRAIGLNGLQALSFFLVGLTFDPWIRQFSVLQLRELDPIVAALIGYLVHTFIYYWWHRARHVSPFLWRWVHQVHHSPQRIEIITSFYKHPIELVLNGILSSLVLFALLGMSPVAVGYTMLLNGLAELFYHWNVRTPHIIGYFMQRPESHCVHHEENLHAGNYGDLPIFDIMFGTFDNPREWSKTCGFGDEAEHRLGEMMLGRDVSS